MNTTTTDCQGHQTTNCPIACNGTSFAAPEVAGAGILVQANHPGLTPLEVKARLLDNAATNLGAGNSVKDSRLLDVAAAVGP